MCVEAHRKDMKTMKGGGRQLNTVPLNHQQNTRKPVGTCLAINREKVFHYWYDLNWPTRQIAKRMDDRREQVEADLRQAVRERISPNPPAPVIPFRRAA